MLNFGLYVQFPLNINKYMFTNTTNTQMQSKNAGYITLGDAH